MASDEKFCASCGRRIEWRKKWAECWDEIRYCSAACRQRKLGKDGRRLEACIVSMLASRARSATICPSEVARECFGEDWEKRMEEVRCAARRLVARGGLVITQAGKVIDASTAKGAIQLGLGGEPQLQ